jgi:hypothetical protein
MSTVTAEYLRTLPTIYQDILKTFPDFAPSRAAGYGLAYQSIQAHLAPKYSLAQIMMACDRMRDGGAVEIKNKIFVCPTQLGEEMIAGLTGKPVAEKESVADFPKPPA